MNIDIPQALSIHGSVRFQIIQKHTGTVLFNCHPMKFLCKIQTFLHMVFTQVGDLGVVFYFFLISSLHLADQKIIFLRFQQILQLYRITDILSIVLSLQTASILNQPFRIQTSHFIGGIRDLCIILFQRQLQHNLQLATRLGAEVVQLEGVDIAETLVNFASERNVRHAIFGKSRLSPLRERLRGSFLLDFLYEAVGVDVHVANVTPKYIK